jgi:D-inositol-3-phosphate glycosyltransferase
MNQTKTEYTCHVGLLTGGNDKHYAVALASALVGSGVRVDFVASTDLDCPEVHVAGIQFLNLRGDQREDVAYTRKAIRLLTYYARLVAYAAICKPKVFHILWNNKFELFDRTLLMLYYRLLGKRLLFTAHNVNAAKRDEKDTWVNRASLRVQYRLCHRIFVHTELMKRQLIDEFDVRDDKVILIPYGINITIPITGVKRDEARMRLGLASQDKVLLFFGQIAPYKGLDYVVQAMPGLVRSQPRLRLVIAGKVKQGWGEYWQQVQQAIATGGLSDRVVEHIHFIQDEEIERYFVAADALVLPYTYIFQSGVLFLAYSFGLPVLATDVGSLKEHIVEARTGFICQPRNATALAETIERYFSSDVYRNLETSRGDIRRLASERHSWSTVGALTAAAYLMVRDGHESRPNGATAKRQNA